MHTQGNRKKTLDKSRSLNAFKNLACLGINFGETSLMLHFLFHPAATDVWFFAISLDTHTNCLSTVRRCRRCCCCCCCCCGHCQVKTTYCKCSALLPAAASRNTSQTSRPSFFALHFSLGCPDGR
jgi:hypothetical protein